MTPASWGIRLLCLGEAVPSNMRAEMHESCRPLRARALGKTSRIDFLICSLSEFCLGTGLVLGAVSHLCCVSASCHIHYPAVTPKLGQQASRRWEREEQEQSPFISRSSRIEVVPGRLCTSPYAQHGPPPPATGPVSPPSSCSSARSGAQATPRPPGPVADYASPPLFGHCAPLFDFLL